VIKGTNPETAGKTGCPTAVTREVSSTLGDCALTFLERVPIDVAKAMEQHRRYAAILGELGMRVILLPADAAYPDGVFVEDPAIVLDEIAVICRPGAESRRGEADSVAEAIAPFRELKWMREPATMEGGDVVRVGRDLFVGVSQRTNREGVEQLAGIVEPFGYRVTPVEVHGCLHLKSACCSIGDSTVLINRNWIDAGPFAGFRMIDVEEEWAADVLRIGGAVLMPDGFPKTREKLERSGFRTLAIDVSELQKAEAGVTCMSLILD
jgi:dimethylargininase